MSSMGFGGRIALAFLTSFSCVVAAKQGAIDLALENAHISPILYFPSATAELSSRQALHVQLGPLVKDLATTDGKSLVPELDKAWQTFAALQRHVAYLRTQSLEDTQDQTVKSAYDAVATDESVLRTAIDNRVRQVPQDQVSSLGAYALLAARLHADATHASNADLQVYRSSVTKPHERAIADAYNALISAVTSSRGTAASDLATRRAAIARRDQAYDAAAPVAATLLATLVDLENRDAVAQGYANAADRKYESLGLSSDVLNQTLAAVGAESSAYRNYQQIIAEHAARKLGVSPILSAEQDLAAVKPPPIPLSAGRQLILDALRPLGQDYGDRFAALLDPANGRLDLTGGSHRARTGTSIAVYDAPVALYYSGYDGSLRSLSVIAHEGGHAVHRELMNASGIPIYQRTGPNYLFEGFALLNELLVLDRATHIANTPAEREYALERLLSTISFELFASAEETGFERSLYLTASGHAPLDRAQIDKIYQDSITPYEYWPMSDVGTSRQWMQKSLLFEDPLYLVNYLYAAFVAVALLDKAESDPDFARKYAALLRRGFDAEPQTLLQAMGIRLDDPSLAKATSRFFQARTAELQSLYVSEAHAPFSAR
jgi:oligoendopeptidase F